MIRRGRISEGDTLSKTFFLGVPGQYVFGVRAVDVAGAVEPFLEFGRNAFKFQTFAKAGSPALTIRRAFAGHLSCSPESVRRGKSKCRWAPSCGSRGPPPPRTYGGGIDGYSWGLDIPDLDREGPNSGWSGWGQILGNFQPIVFTKSGIRVLYVRARDISGTVTLGTLIMNVLDFPLDREVLWVDDSRDKTYPDDTQHDAFWTSLFRDSERFDMETDFFKFEVHGANDTYSATPIPPTLEQLGRYKLIVWECLGRWLQRHQRAARGYFAEEASRSVSGRGRQAVDRRRVDRAADAAVSQRHQRRLRLPQGHDDADQNSFAYQFMKLASGQIRNAKGVPPDDNMMGVMPFPGRPEIYPQMDQDPNKISPYKGSISHGDVIVEPIYVQDAGFTGVIDSLYVYQAKRPASTYNNKLNAIRWYDPDPARPHGRTQWFGFQMYFMKKDQAQSTFNRAIDWFREEQPPNANP